MEPEVETRQQFWGDHKKPKEAEASNMYGMPATGALGKGPDKGSKTTIPKTGAASFIDAMSKIGEAECPDDNLETPVTGEQPVQNAQAQPVKSRIDVSQKEPPKVIQEKEAQYLALPSQGRYPLDSYTDVKTAAAYYDEWGVRFSPEHSHEYCCNLVKRAEALGIKVSDTVRKYGSEKYASAPEISAGILGRLNVLQDEEHRDILSKLASERMMLTPDLFATTLSEFDKLAGLDQMYGRDVLDPYYTTFGFEKTATETLDDDDGDNGSHIIGNDYVTNKQLKRLAHGPMDPLKVHYGEDFVEEFRKDPVGIFKSLPADQKKHISRMAAEEDMPVG